MTSQKDTEINELKSELTELQAIAKQSGGDDTQRKLDTFNEQILNMKQQILQLKSNQSKKERGADMTIVLEIDQYVF